MSEPDLDEIDNEDFSEEIPKSEGSVVYHLLGQLHFGMSLSRITLPTFILETRSTIERFTDWMAHADILQRVHNEPDPLIRCLHLCTWIVSGFHLAPRTPKKPYNSLLGEVFRSVVKDKDGKPFGTYIAEQVSHHPPISSFFYHDYTYNLFIWGHSEMKSKFLGNSIVAQMDENTVVNFDIPNIDESYTFNFPNMYGRGIFFGRLIMEIAGTVNIQCQKTGITAKIEFLEKPMLFGRYNQFRGQIFDPSDSKPKIEFDGRWSAFMRVNDKRNDDHPYLCFDVRKDIPLSFDVPPIDQQTMYESQNVWKEVTRYIKANDLSHATDHKLALEEKQRKEEKFFEENNLEWTPQCFYYCENEKRYIPCNLEKERNQVVEMPPPFEIPKHIKTAMDQHITRTIKETQDDVEQQILGGAI